MKTAQYQRGIGSLGWVAILAIGGFVLTCFFRLGPHYMDNISVRDALRSLAEQNDDVNNLDKEQIFKQLNNYILINNVRGKEAQAFKVVRRKDYTLVNNAYEVRVPMFYNVDVVLTFKSQLDSSKPETCCEYIIENED